MVAITTPVAPSGERLREKVGVVCLQCENCVIHTWALQRRVSYYGTLYKCLLSLTSSTKSRRCHSKLTSSARAMMASRLFDEGPEPGSDWTAMLRLQRGGISNQSGSRMPSRQSFATGYMAPLPSRSISGAVCYKFNTIMMITATGINKKSVWNYCALCHSKAVTQPS